MKPEPFLDQGKNSKVPTTASSPSSKDKEPKIKKKQKKNRADCFESKVKRELGPMSSKGSFAFSLVEGKTNILNLGTAICLHKLAVDLGQNNQSL